MSYRNEWPSDRVQRFDELRALAKTKGLKLKIKTEGNRRIRMFCMTIWRGDACLGFTLDIDEAEQMVRAEVAQ